MCLLALVFKIWHYAKICMTPPVGKSLSRRQKQNIQCPDIPAAIRPVPHGGALPVSEAPQDFTNDPDVEQSVSSKNRGGLLMR